MADGGKTSTHLAVHMVETNPIWVTLMKRPTLLVNYLPLNWVSAICSCQKLLWFLYNNKVGCHPTYGAIFCLNLLPYQVINRLLAI